MLVIAGNGGQVLTFSVSDDEGKLMFNVLQQPKFVKLERQSET